MKVADGCVIRLAIEVQTPVIPLSLAHADADHDRAVIDEFMDEGGDKPNPKVAFQY